MTGGTLNAAQLQTGGEQSTAGSGPTTIDLGGSSTVSLSQNVTNTLNRNLVVRGPGVNFSTAGSLRLQSPSSYTAMITSATAHSPLKATGNVTLGGTLNINFSGLVSNPAVGQTWDLFDYGGLLAGSFTNSPIGQDITVGGLPQPVQTGATFQLRQTTGGVNGKRVQLIQTQTLVLHVNRNTGEMKITNPLGGTIEIDGYTVNSARGSLLTGYKGISGAPAADTGWTKTPNLSASALAEVKQTGSFNVSGIGAPGVTLGTGFSKTAVAGNVANFGQDGEDLVFRFNQAGIGPRVGHIIYEGTKFENDLVLRVNPNTGQAFLKNDSNVNLKVDGITILSSTGALNVTSFSPIAGGTTTGTWQKSTATGGSLSQTNLTGSTSLAPTAEVPIGNITNSVALSTAAQAGLSFQFLLAESLTAAPAAGDYNNNGVVDAADYTIWRNAANTAGTLPNQNPAATTPNLIDQEDYTFWKQNFGNVGGPQPELTFRTGSVVFDTSAGAGSGGLVGAAVPEPNVGILMLAGLGSWLGFGRNRTNRKRRLAQTAPVRTTGGHLGVRNMSKHIAIAIGVVACVVSALPAFAATGGIPLVNGDFNLPGTDKVRPFDANGNPLASNTPITQVGNGDRIGGIPGWSFSGPGMEVRFNGIDEMTMMPYIKGDSSVEPGAGFGAGSGTHLTLSTNDGTAFQTTGTNVQSLSVNEKYKLTFSAFDAFTIDAGNPNFMQINNRGQLTAKLYYDNAGTRVSIKTQAFDILSNGMGSTYTLEVPGGTIPGVAVGKPIGVEFDTTTIERNAGMPEFPVAHSWAAIDNVLLQVSGVKAGDFNGDGFVNATDYAVVNNNQQTSQLYDAQGDITGDGFVNLNDFRAFKTAFASAGTGSIDFSGFGVPEPSTILMLLTPALAIGCRRRRASSKLLSLVFLSVLALVSATARESSAELKAYDPFRIGPTPANGEYVVTNTTTTPFTNPLAGQNPTIGPATGTPPTSFFRDPWTVGSAGGIVQATGLSYLGSPAIGGSATGYGRTERYFQTPWDATTNGTFYIGFSMNFGTTTTPSMGYRAFEIFPPNVVPGENRVFDLGYNEFFSSFGIVQQQPATAKMQFNVSGVAQQIVDGSPTSYLQDGSTHLVILKFELSTTANDIITLYLDPTTAVESDYIPNNTASVASFIAGSLGYASFDNDGHGGTTVFDELRVGTTFADVVPEFPVPGDTDGDRDVDLDDYNNIFNNFNKINQDTMHGDVALSNGRQGADGKVDLGDFFLWKKNFPTPGPGVGASFVVPEPASIVFAFACLAIVALQRRRN